MQTLSKLMVLVAAGILTAQPGEVQAQDFPKPGAIFEIREYTRNERVAVGAFNNNVLRWKRTAGKEQLFKLHPAGNGKWAIESLKENGGRYLVVEGGGNIRAKFLKDKRRGEDHIFRFEKAGTSNRFRIREGTKNEYVAVGSDGNVLRWARTGKNDQLFQILLKK